ncbi:hypothetical protein BJ546DRAFT_969624 [Cryomyces antarcticus]
MSTPHGSAISPSPSPPTRQPSHSPTLTKRKRAQSPSHADSNGTVSGLDGEDGKGERAQVQTTMQDFLTVLRSYDTKPSILEYSLRTDREDGQSPEPATKRAKLSQPPVPKTIASKIEQGSYTELADLEHDVHFACEEILVPIKAREAPSARSTGGSYPMHNAESQEDQRLVASVIAFRKMARKLVLRESQLKLVATQRNGMSEGAAIEGKGTPNGVVDAGPTTVDDEDDDTSKKILTLFGNAPHPRQLFSSFPRPLRFTPSNEPLSSASPDASVDVVVPLREPSLPNMITATRVLPVRGDGALSGKTKDPTFADLFAPPATLSQLSPPRPFKKSTTRGSTITWVDNDPLSSSVPKGSYTTQSLSTGKWLGYGGVDPPEEPSSPGAMRKMRDRALSTGEPNPAPSESTRLAQQQAKEEALFRSVYSSFAPSRDDAVALVPAETKDRVWWYKVGEKRYEQAFAIDPILLDAQDTSTQKNSMGADEEVEFKTAVESFVPEVDATFAVIDGDKTEDKDAAQILEEISGLLETLYSYQRIRNASLASNSRTPVGQNTSLTAMTGSPAIPSSAEVDVYKMLKDQLALMILSLPPYAVAKLNGDQLAELSISPNILSHGKNYKGQMEEDQVSRLARAAAMTAAVSSAAPSRVAAPSNASYQSTSTQYARTSSMPQSAVSRPSHGAQSYYPQQQIPSRTPSMNHTRPSIPVPPAYATPGSQRPSYTQMSSSYGQQTVRPQQPSYGQSNGQQYPPQRTNQPNYGYNQQYSQSTSAGQTRYAPSPSTYQSRGPNTAPMYPQNAISSPYTRTASPQKAPSHAAPPPNYQQSQVRPIYPPSNGSQTGQYYQPPAQTGRTTPVYTPQPQTPSAVGPSGFHTSMTTEQQQLMMDRQRAQLAMQPQARMAAQPGVIRQGSGTPQPPPAENGQYEPNGTSGPQGAPGTPMVA